MSTGEGKTKVEMELDELRGKGLAKKNSGKYSVAGAAPLSTPEQAFAFLAAQRAAKKLKAKAQSQEPPKNLNSNDLDDWFMRQRKQDAEMKRKQKEAMSILRSYRASTSGLENKDFTGGAKPDSLTSPRNAPSEADAKSTVYSSFSSLDASDVKKSALAAWKDRESASTEDDAATGAEAVPAMLDEDDIDDVDDENFEEVMKGYMEAKEAEGAPVAVDEEGEVVTEKMVAIEEEVEVDSSAAGDAGKADEEKDDDIADDADAVKEVADKDTAESADDTKEESSDETSGDAAAADKTDDKEEAEEDSPKNAIETKEDSNEDSDNFVADGGENTDAEKEDVDKEEGSDDPSEDVAAAGGEPEKEVSEEAETAKEDDAEEDSADNDNIIAVKQKDGNKTTDDDGVENDDVAGTEPKDDTADDAVVENDVAAAKAAAKDDTAENGESAEKDDADADADADNAPKEESETPEDEEVKDGEAEESPVLAVAETDKEEKKSDESVTENKEEDEFSWRSNISSEEGSQFPPEQGRYHLYASYACPWAHRALMVWSLKGLEDAISVTVVHPIWRKTNPKNPDDSHIGWVFGNPDGETFRNTAGLGGPFPSAYHGNEADPVFNAYSIRELYGRANDALGKYTVPLLWDKKLNTIVNNESSEIIRILNSEFNEFAKNPDLDLYPKDEQKDIDKVNEWIHPSLNNSVYRCGFATSQEAYDRAIDELTESFDKVDSILQKQKYLVGDNFTEADVRLFVTLLRFDEVSSIYMKTNTRSVATTPAILRYCRDIYRIPGVAETCHMDQIKAHYYCSHVELNRYSIIPRGPDFMALLKETDEKEE